MATAAKDKKDDEKDTKAAAKTPPKDSSREAEQAAKDKQQAEERDQKAVAKKAGNDNASQGQAEELAEVKNELQRAYIALATVRKMAIERPNLTPNDVIGTIVASGVETSDFDRLAAGV